MSQTPFLDSLLSSQEGVQGKGSLRPNEEASNALVLLAFLGIGGAFTLPRIVGGRLAQPKARKEEPANEIVGSKSSVEGVGEQISDDTDGEYPRLIQTDYPTLAESNNAPVPAEWRPNDLLEAKKRADSVKRRAYDSTREHLKGIAIQKTFDETPEITTPQRLTTESPEPRSATSSSNERLQRVQFETRMQLLDQREICRNKGLEAVQRWEQTKKLPSKRPRQERVVAVNREDGKDDGRTVLWSSKSSRFA